MVYRSDTTSMTRERAMMLAKLRELESGFTDTFWRELAPAMDLVRSSAWQWSATKLEDEVEALITQIARIEAVLGRWASIWRGWARPAPRAPIGEGSSLASLDDLALASMLARDRIEQEITGARVSIPIDVRVRPTGRALRWGVATSAPRGAGQLLIQPERLLDDLRKMAGVLSDIDTGDNVFDGAFLVRGHEPTARALLDRRTRRQLLRIGAACADLEVRLSAGEALVWVRAPPERGLVLDAVEILQRLREAPIRSLRTDR